MTSDSAPIPDDDPQRSLTVARTDDPDAVHLSLAGDTYTVLVSGAQTAGRYCLIDMHVPDGGGPPLHRHDFEEMFTVLDGEITFMFRDETVVAMAGTTVNIPANAPHHFANRSGSTARMLCMCTPAGQDEYFEQIADVVDSATAPPPDLTDAQLQERRKRGAALAPSYATEML